MAPVTGWKVMLTLSFSPVVGFDATFRLFVGSSGATCVRSLVRSPVGTLLMKQRKFQTQFNHQKFRQNFLSYLYLNRSLARWEAWKDSNNGGSPTRKN